MLTPVELRSRLIAITIGGPIKMQLCQADELLGCSKLEIKELERAANFSLPTSYKEFMAVAGKGAGEFLSKCRYKYLDIIRCNLKTKEAYKKYFPFPEPCFVFGNWNGNAFVLFTNENDNPPIYGWNGTKDGLDKFYDTFWDFVEFELQSMERKKNH